MKKRIVAKLKGVGMWIVAYMFVEFAPKRLLKLLLIQSRLIGDKEGVAVARTILERRQQKRRDRKPFMKFVEHSDKIMAEIIKNDTQKTQ